MPEEYFVNGPHAPVTPQAIIHHAIFVGCLKDKLAQLKKIYIQYHTNKYSDQKNATYGKEYGELNQKNQGFKMPNGLWLNNPFVTKQFI
jgi:type I restriction-modification system DNA methylase subunit